MKNSWNGRIKVMFSKMGMAILLVLTFGYADNGLLTLQNNIIQTIAAGETPEAWVQQWQSIHADHTAISERESLYDNYAQKIQQALIEIEQIITMGDRADQQQLLVANEKLTAEILLLKAELSRITETLQADETLSVFLERHEAVVQHLDAQFMALEAAMGQLVMLKAVGHGESTQRRIMSRQGEKVEANTVEAITKQAQMLIQQMQASQQNEPMILRNNQLPLRPLELPPREPVYAAVPVIPAWQGGDFAVTDADTLPAKEAPLTETINKKAAELDHDVVQIYEFVRNKIETEWYSGLTKGALGTLQTGRGNAADQAALLVALLRASSIPSRYVEGVIEQSTDALAKQMGVKPTEVTQVLARAGIPFKPIIQGGRVAAVEMQQTWVTVLVPYTNYRGVLMDKSGESWIPLDPSIKFVERSIDETTLSAAGLTVEYLLSEYRKQVQRQSFADFVETQLKDKNIQPAQLMLTIVPQNLQILPNTLPYTVKQVNRESAEFNTENIVTATLKLDQVQNPSEGLEITLPVYQLLSQRLTLSYEPATLEDHRVALSFGGMDLTPGYLIRLRARLMLEGTKLLAGQESLEMGEPIGLSITLEGSFGTETVTQTLRVGMYHAIAIGDHVLRKIDPFESTADLSEGTPVLVGDLESDAAWILDGISIAYLQRQQQGEKLLAGFLNTLIVHPLPSIMMVNNSYQTDYIDGVALASRWQGVTMDVLLNITESIGNNAVNLLTMSALHGSSLEHTVFEDLLQVESLSSDKGLTLAAQQGVNILKLNTPVTLPDYLTESNKAAIQQALLAGLKVSIPDQPLQHATWQGAVWQVEAEETGASGYFIAGQLAGGATLQPWTLQFLKDLLAGINNGHCLNSDPMAARYVEVLTATNGQYGTVGQALPYKIALRVLDQRGCPVRQARVFVEVESGEGKLDDGQSQNNVLELTSNELGIAEVSWILGEKTSINPIYLKKQTSDEYPYQAGWNTLNAYVMTPRGAQYLESPLTAVAFPDAAVNLLRVDSLGNERNVNSLAWVGNLRYRALDQYQNPVPNIAVSASSQIGQSLCGTSSAIPKAKIFDANKMAIEGEECSGEFPNYYSCGAESLMTYTNTEGNVVIGVLVGNHAAATYHINLNGAGIADTVSFKTTDFQKIKLGENTTHCVANLNVRVDIMYRTERNGQNINAAKVSTTFQDPYEVNIYGIAPKLKEVETEYQSVLLACLDESSILSEIKPVTLDSDPVFRVSNAGSASVAIHLGNNVWQSFITAGGNAGKNEVKLNGFSGEFNLRPYTVVDSCNREDELYFAKGFYNEEIILPSLYGLLPEVKSFTSLIRPIDILAGEELSPEVIHLGDNGRTRFPVIVGYQTQPAEYVAANVNVEIYKENQLLNWKVGTSRQDQGSVLLDRGTEFDINKKYYAELVVNPGKYEVRSETIELPFKQRLIADYTRQLLLGSYVDLVNDTACRRHDPFKFTLRQSAKITLTAEAYADVAPPEGEMPSLTGNIITLIHGENYDLGEQEFNIDFSMLLPRRNGYLLTLTAEAGEVTEEKSSYLGTYFMTNDSLSVGSIIVRGVNVNTGRLIHTGPELSYKGRGPVLRFTPMYVSRTGQKIGSMGANWTHNYEADLNITNCGDVIINTGDTGSIRFIPEGDGFKAAVGYHGKLLRGADNSFDFYSKDGTHYHFKWFIGLSHWKLVTIKDTNQNTLSLVYNKAEQDAPLLSVTDSSDRVLLFQYEYKTFERQNNQAILSKVIGPKGESIAFTYDKFGNLLSLDKHEGTAVEQYTYLTDAEPFRRHQLTSVTNANGAVTRYVYLDQVEPIAGIDWPTLRVHKITLPDQSETTFTYQGTLTSEEKTTVVHDNAITTTYTLNRQGAPVKVVDPAATTQMTWSSANGLMQSRTDGLGTVYTYTYDAAGNVVTEQIVGQDVEMTRQKTWLIQNSPPFIQNRLLSETDGRGKIITYEYDVKGNLEKETRPEGVVIHYSYLPTTGDLRSITDGLGTKTQYYYGDIGLPEKVVVTANVLTDLTEETTMTYDIVGNMREKKDPQGRKTFYIYNRLNQLVEQSGPLGRKYFSYDLLGNKLAETDEKGITTHWEYDAMSRVIRHSHDQGSRTMNYDAAGNLVKSTDWLGQITTYTYDTANRLKHSQTSEGVSISYTYDALGNVKSETNSKNGQTLYTYDGLSRRLSVQDPEGHRQKMTYDENNNLLTTVDALGTTTVKEYDGLNRVKKTLIQFDP